MEPVSSGEKPTINPEVSCLATMHSMYCQLESMGWRDAIYAPKDGSEFLSIEAGSTGTHRTIRDEDGGFWILAGDMYPAHPILFKTKGVINE